MATFILLYLIGLVLVGVYAYVYIKDKYKNPYFLVSAGIWLLLPAFLTAGVLIKSDRLLAAAIFVPITLAVISTNIEILLRYKRCTQVVSAKYVSYASRGRGMYYAPEFSYYYDGVQYDSVATFMHFSNRKFNRNFKKDDLYEIYINPNNPQQCADKRFYPTGSIVGLVLSVIFLLFVVIVII